MIRTPLLVSVWAACGYCAVAGAQTNLPEVEPNGTAAQALANGPLVLTSADTIIGDAAGSVDVFLVQTAAAGLGIYRHELRMTMPGLPGYPAGTGVPSLGISPGVGQTDGFITPRNGNPSIQVGNSTTQPLSEPGMRSVVWYGFGKGEKLYVTVGTGTSTSTGYVLTLTDTAVTTSSPVAILDAGNVPGGVISIAASATGGDVSATNGTKLWVYDSNFNAIPGYGNHKKTGAPTNTSLLVRDFPTTGDFYVAVGVAGTSAGVLANDQLEPREDTVLTDSLMPFPNSVCEAYASYDVNQSVSIVITDGTGVAHPALTTTKTQRGQIIWAKFHVDTTTTTIGACCQLDGSCATGSTAGCALVTGATFQSGVACGSAGCVQPQTGRCCKTDGTCEIGSTYSCATINGQWTGGGTCGAACPSTITTAPTQGGWGASTVGNAGCVFFDIVATNAVDITGLDISMSSTVGLVETIQIWTRAGTYLGFDNNSSGWTQLGTNLTAISPGQVPLTHYNLPSTVHVNAGETVAFCVGAVVVTGPPAVNTFIRYIDINQQNDGIPFTGYTNADITINSDRTRSALFGGTSSAPRGFAGRVYYTTPHACAADFNGANGATVQDIFDFLGAWFAGCTSPGPAPCYKSADVNGVGGVTVQDIFDFLSAWFAGC